MTKPVILIATLMMEQGYCGVQTHFRAVAGFARQQGYEVSVVNPSQVSRWVQKPPALISRVLRKLNRERAILWQRNLDFRFLCMRLRQCLRMLDGRPVVIYAQDPLSASAALALRRQGFKFRLVTVLHFNISEAFETTLNGLTHEGGALWRNLMQIEQNVLPRIDKVIFVSDYMRRIVMARNPALDEAATAVIPNFPESTKPSDPATSSRRADIIAIGTLEPRKNQCYLLHVLAEARRLGHSYRLTLVGDGPSRVEWEILAKDLGIADQIDFLGYVNGAPQLIPGHRVFAHAARMESFGIVLLEAMAHGLPIFAPAVGGIPEVFNDGFEGVIWPLDDASAGAKMLIAVLESPDEWQRMSQAATARYQTHFSPECLGPTWVAAITGSSDATGVNTVALRSAA